MKSISTRFRFYSALGGLAIGCIFLFLFWLLVPYLPESFLPYFNLQNGVLIVASFGVFGFLFPNAIKSIGKTLKECWYWSF